MKLLALLIAGAAAFSPARAACLSCNGATPYFAGVIAVLLIGLVAVGWYTFRPAPRALRAADLPDHERLVHITQHMLRNRLHERPREHAHILLCQQGFQAEHINRVFSAMEQRSRLFKLIHYFEQQSRAGHSLDHLIAWLSSQGVDHDLLSVAVANYKLTVAY